MIYNNVIIQIYSDSSIDELFEKYPIENKERIKELFNSDKLNIKLAIEIYKAIYPELKIIDVRYNTFQWINQGFFPIDSTRTSILKPSTI